MEFFNYLKLNNKVKLLSHIEKGYEENILEYFDSLVNEKEEFYNDYSIGDIVFVGKYKYKSGYNGKNHIFLIVDKYEGESEINYLGMIISSKLEKLKYKENQLILKDNENNLHKNSIIKTDIIYKIFTKNILIKIGNIDKNKVDSYKKLCMM